MDPEPTEPTDPTEPTEPTEPVDPVTPVTPVKTLSFYYEDLPSIAQQKPDGVDDQVKALQAEINALQQAVAYPKEERTRMIRDKNQEIAQLDVTIKLAAVNLEKTKKEVGSDTVYSELDGTIKAALDPNSPDFTNDKAVVEVSGGGGYYIDGALSELELGTVSIGEKVQVNSWMTGASAEGEIVEKKPAKKAAKKSADKAEEAEGEEKPAKKTAKKSTKKDAE